MDSLLGTGIFNADGKNPLRYSLQLCLKWLYVEQVVFGSASSILTNGTDELIDRDFARFHRSITRPFFTRERVSDFEIYKRNSDISLKAAKDRLSEGYSVDFQVCYPR